MTEPMAAEGTTISTATGGTAASSVDYIKCAVLGEEGSDIHALVQSLVSRKPVTTPDAQVAAAMSTKGTNPRFSVVLGSGAHVGLEMVIVSEDRPIPLNAKLALLAYSPVVPRTADALTILSQELDRCFPRPHVVLVATRVEQLASRKVLDKMQAAGIVAVQPEEASELAMRLRAVSYVEISTAFYGNMITLEEALGKAAVGEANRRATPEVISEMRTAVITMAASSQQTTWTARRDKKSGRLFYVNRRTRAAQWTRPADFDGQEPELTEDERKMQEAARIQAEEVTRREEREKQFSSQLLREAEEHDNRMRDMERQSDALVTAVAMLQAQLEGLRAQMQRNVVLRQQLERQREEMMSGEGDFVRSASDRDAVLEQELLTARGRAFELEALTVMRNEKDYDVHTAELLMKNRSLASRIKEAVNEQLQAQRDGAATQAQWSLVTRQAEAAARQHNQSQLNQSTLRHDLAEQHKQVAILRQSAQRLESDCQTLATQLRSLTDGGVVADEEDLRRANNTTSLGAERTGTVTDPRRLLRAIAEIDSRIAAASPAATASHRVDGDDSNHRLLKGRPSKGAAEPSNLLAGVADDVQRLRYQRDLLVAKLSQAEAAVAATEIEGKRAIAKLEYLTDSRRRQHVDALRVLEVRARLADNEMRVFELGPGYSGVNRDELERVTKAVSDTTWSARHHVDLVGRRDMVGTLRRKLEHIDALSTDLRKGLADAGEALRRRHRQHALDEEKYAEVTRLAVDTLEAVEPRVAAAAGGDLASSGVTPTPVTPAAGGRLEYLRAKVAPCVANDGLLLDRLCNEFTGELRRLEASRAS